MTLKTLQKEVQSGRKALSKFELTETQFERTVKDKIACKTHFEAHFWNPHYISYPIT